MKVTVGCDPEVFLHDGAQFISAHGLFPGTKKEPHKVDKGAVQVDGMALEFNIEPANSEEEFNNNIVTVLKQMTEMVHKVDRDLKLRFIPIARFDPLYFSILPVESKILGCDPDYSAETGMQKAPPGDLEHRPFRTTAGHVHLGWTDGADPFDPAHFEDCRHIAKSFKNATYFKPTTPEEFERIRYYGGESSFRPKTYGVELRSPSSRWVEKEDDRRMMYRSIISRMEDIEANALHNS